MPVLTERTFGKGRGGIYLSGYRYSPENTHALRSILEQGLVSIPLYTTYNPYVDCAYFPGGAKTLVLVNGSEKVQKVRIKTGERVLEEKLAAFEMTIHHLVE